MSQLSLFDPPESSESTSSLPDILASLSASPGTGLAKRMTVGSGQKCSALYAKQSPVGFLVRTLTTTSIWGSTLCLLTWKAKVTKHSRLYFQLQASTPPTEETEYSLWRTPAAANGTQGPKSREFYEHCLKTGQSTITLTDQVRHNPGRMWPTPTANEREAWERIERGIIRGNLCDAVGVEEKGKLWPTPLANDAEKRGNIALEARNGLPAAVRMPDGAKPGQLNPFWEEMLMSFPIGWTDIGDSSDTESK